MKNLTRNVLFLVCALTIVSVLTGCTDWKKRYEVLNVEHQNLKGRYDNCISSLEGAASDKAQLNRALSDSQQQLEDLRRQINDKKVSKGKATGFGDEMDVDVDTVAGTITVKLPDAILFAPGKTSLIGTTSNELDHIYNVLQDKYKGRQLEVVGNTDSDPIKKSKWEDNWQLSSERALTVLRYLVNKGIHPEYICAVAAGEGKPVASNSTAAGKAKNRRVEVVVHLKK